MQDQKAGWNEWLAAYAETYDALPEPAGTRCPNCGSGDLHLAFTGLVNQRVGYASFWCNSCLFGIHLSRCLVPDGVEMESVHTPPESRATQIPNYTLVQPDDEDSSDTESHVF